MLEIVNERGEIMELAEDTAIPVERNSSLFNENDTLFMDVSYPGKAPVTSKNKQFFSGGHRLYADNDLYEFDVWVYLSSNLVFSGKLNYKYSQESFDFTIKPNYAAVSKRAKDYTFDKVRFNDGYAIPSGSYLQIEAYMLETCRNPQNYPAVFFPVANNNISESLGAGVTTYGMVNYFDGVKFHAQRLNEKAHFESPYFRLNYIISKVCEFLGFRAAGSIFTDEEMMMKCIYTRVCRYNMPNANIYAFEMSNRYMPEMSMSDFLTDINSRYGLVVDFDLNSKIATFHTLRYVLSESVIHDLEDYMSELTEISTVVEKGVTVRLQTDSSDAEFNIEMDSGVISAPTNVLKIGDGEKAITLRVGTLKAADANSSPVKNNVKSSQPVIDVDGNASAIYYTAPSGSGRPDRNGSNRPRESIVPGQVSGAKDQLRIIKYAGLSQGLPASYPDELTEADALKFKFLNSAKKVKCNASLPSGMLPRVKIFDRVSFTTKEGFYAEALIEKMAYDLRKASRTKVLFELRLISKMDADISLLPGFTLVDEESYSGTFVKAIFPSTISQVRFEVWTSGPPSGTKTKFAEYTIKSSTDNWGAGGDTASLRIPKALTSYARGSFRVRFYNEKPSEVRNYATNALKDVTYEADYGDVLVRAGENLLLVF